MVVCYQQQIVMGYLTLLFLCLRIEVLWDSMLCLGWEVPEILRECVALILKDEEVPNYMVCPKSKCTDFFI